MKGLTFSLFLLFSWNPITEIDYRALSLYSMIDNADLIIQSEIISQNDTSITVKIIHNLKGNDQADNVQINKFRDWSCASRYASYKVGQQQIFILKQVKNNLYRVSSPGNEGELPIENDKIHYKSWLNRKSEFKSAIGKVSGFAFDFNASIQGLKRIVEFSKKVPTKELSCEIINYNPKSDIEKMIFEEVIIWERLFRKCENFNTLKLQVINSKMYRF